MEVKIFSVVVSWGRWEAGPPFVHLLAEYRLVSRVLTWLLSSHKTPFSMILRCPAGAWQWRSWLHEMEIQWTELRVYQSLQSIFIAMWSPHTRAVAKVHLLEARRKVKLGHRVIRTWALNPGLTDSSRRAVVGEELVETIREKRQALRPSTPPQSLL